MSAHDYVRRISRAGVTIYSPITPGSDLWIGTEDLESLLNEHLRGLMLAGLPLRTRSKVVKEHVCTALGYPTPRTFSKTKPRFPGQNFDTYIQKSNNLQVWNEEISINRRYVLIRVSDVDVIQSVRVVTGELIAKLDHDWHPYAKVPSKARKGGTRHGASHRQRHRQSLFDYDSAGKTENLLSEPQRSADIGISFPNQHNILSAL